MGDVMKVLFIRTEKALSEVNMGHLRNRSQEQPSLLHQIKLLGAWSVKAVSKASIQEVINIEVGEE
jgi:hypothetical protein